MLPTPVTGSGPHGKGVIARRVLAFDFEVTTIVNRNHLSINGVRAKGINYFREKSLDFFVQPIEEDGQTICSASMLANDREEM